MVEPLPKLQHSRRPHDTAEWCAERAAADRISAAAADNENIRERFEVSAASWSARAAMLRMIAKGIAGRGKAARAEWDEEDVPLRAALRAGAKEPTDVRL
jgi:hypothetical protein